MPMLEAISVAQLSSVVLEDVIADWEEVWASMVGQVVMEASPDEGVVPCGDLCCMIVANP